jgi:hypothetical protein
MKENGMMAIPHPHYSPDLASFDFYLFSYLKHYLREQSFETADELVSASEMISMRIEKSTLAFCSSGCRDFWNAVQPMAMILTTFIKGNEQNHRYSVDGEMLHPRRNTLYQKSRILLC